jgi:hypothetical protein
MRWVVFFELVVFVIDQPLLRLLKFSSSDEEVGLELDFVVNTIRESIVMTIVFCCMVSTCFLAGIVMTMHRVGWTNSELITP